MQYLDGPSVSPALDNFLFMFIMRSTQYMIVLWLLLQAASHLAAGDSAAPASQPTRAAQLKTSPTQTIPMDVSRGEGASSAPKEEVKKRKAVSRKATSSMVSRGAGRGRKRAQRGCFARDVGHNRSFGQVGVEGTEA